MQCVCIIYLHFQSRRRDVFGKISAHGPAIEPTEESTLQAVATVPPDDFLVVLLSLPHRMFWLER